MTDSEFCSKLRESFLKYLETGSRSNAKLKILHGSIALDIKERMEKNGVECEVMSLGVNDDRECNIDGEFNKKAVDITFLINNTPVAGIAVKFVMRNYSQNSNNYFENMLGETVNIRGANVPYFQIFIIMDKLPYFTNSGGLAHWEEISSSNLSKYITLSNKSADSYMHIPNKMLVFIAHIDVDSDIDEDTLQNESEYKKYYIENETVFSKSENEYDFGDTVIYNKYELFANSVADEICSEVSEKPYLSLLL